MTNGIEIEPKPRNELEQINPPAGLEGAVPEIAQSESDLNHIQPQITEEAPSVHVAQEDSTSRKEKSPLLAVVSTMAALAILAGISQTSPDRGEAKAATPISLEKAKTPKVKVPKITPNMEISSAKLALKKAGLRPAGLKPNNKGKIPKASPGHELVVTGWAKKVVKRVRNRAGKLVNKISYPVVRSGTKLPKGSPLFIRTREVDIPQQPPEDTPKPEPIDRPVDVPEGITPPVREPVTPVPIENVPSPEIDLNAETEKFLKSETVQIPFLNNCSGMLIRNQDNRIIGAVSARHCGLGDATVRIQGSDGNLYVVKSEPLQVKRGENTNNMSTVFTAGQVIVAPEGDPGHDLAIVVSTSSTPTEVLNEVQKNLISEGEIAGLSPGTEMTISGFPNAQPGNTTGVIRRQSMKAGFIGTTNVFTANNQTIYSIMVGMKPNVDGAICSYGASGGVGVLPRVILQPDGTKKVSFKWLGILAAYDDFRLPGENTVVAEGYYGPLIRQQRFEQSGYAEVLKPDLAGVCYTDHKIPGPSNRQIIRIYYFEYSFSP